MMSCCLRGLGGGSLLSVAACRILLRAGLGFTCILQGWLWASIGDLNVTCFVYFWLLSVMNMWSMVVGTLFGTFNCRMPS